MNKFIGIEEKFIVLNTKRFEEMNKEYRAAFDTKADHPAVTRLIEALERFALSYQETTGKQLTQKYIAFNQDEPYANALWEVIREFEVLKKRNENIRIIVGLEGGIVQGASSTTDVELTVFDYDTDGAEGDDLFVNTDGSTCLVTQPGSVTEPEWVEANLKKLLEEEKN